MVAKKYTPNPTLQELKGKVRLTIQGIIDENKLKNLTLSKSKQGQVTHVDFLDTDIDSITKVMDKLSDVYGINVSGTKSNPPQISENLPTKFKVGKSSPTHFVSFRPFTKSSGRLPTDVQEHGTSYILGRLVRENANNGQMYKSAQQIFDDKDTYEGLKADVFYNYQDKLKEWIYTYFQQQKQFLDRKNYAGVEWSEFRYQNNSFVHLFETYIRDDGLYNDFEKGMKVAKYTEWNPADIYAAKNMGKIKLELDKIFNKGMPGPDGASLIELNGYLQKLMKEKRLVGLSLKKIKTSANLKTGAEAILVERNSMFAKSKFKDPKIEDKNFTMNDIKFVIDNIHLQGLVSTYINFGTSFAIDVRSSSSKFQSLDWATQIKGKAAQGGNAPRDMVVKLTKLKGKGKVTFKNDHFEYPRTIQEYMEPSLRSAIKYNLKDYENWFTWLKRRSYFKSSLNIANFGEFHEYIADLYNKGNVSGGAPAAQTKLMSLHFFYDSLSSNSDDENYWLRILYLGMKVGKIFAPHAKIY